MAARPSDKIQSRIESKTWWLIGLSILMILGFSLTIPLLLLSLVRAGVLEGVLPADGGFSIVVGLLGLAALFSLNLVYQQAQINKMRRRMVQDQMDLEQSKSRLAELTSLFQLGNSLHMDLPLETILEITVRRIGSTLHAHDVDIFILSRETKSLHCTASFGLAPRPPQPDVPYGEGPVGSCARNRGSILLVAGDRSAPFAEFLASRTDTGSILFLPIQAEKRCVGVLQISRAASAEAFRAEHRDVAQLFADNIGPVIERARGAASLRQNTAAVADVPAPVESSVAGSFQDSFLHSAGQELKSPLTAIVAYSEVLDQNDKRMTPAMRTEFTGRVRSEAQRMMGLVDDVLDLVRLELGRYVLELRLGNVNDLVKEAADAVRPLAAAKGISLELTLDDTITNQHLDPAKLRHSVIHLLRNAVRFSPVKSRVTVGTKLGDGEVRISVADKGPAIEAADPAEIFEIDVVARNDQKRARNGEGFGLHLTKRFVELHGGSVGAGASPDGGSVLWIQLPWSSDLSTLVGADPFVEELTQF
ncbi:MAG TPA: GAF domain-containing sensor histidine kinase [Candidatus Eisenbacteria bacterium]